MQILTFWNRFSVTENWVRATNSVELHFTSLEEKVHYLRYECKICHLMHHRNAFWHQQLVLIARQFAGFEGFPVAKGEFQHPASPCPHSPLPWVLRGFVPFPFQLDQPLASSTKVQHSSVTSLARGVRDSIQGTTGWDCQRLFCLCCPHSWFIWLHRSEHLLSCFSALLTSFVFRTRNLNFNTCGLTRASTCRKTSCAPLGRCRGEMRVGSLDVSVEGSFSSLVFWLLCIAVALKVLLRWIKC